MTASYRTPPLSPALVGEQTSSAFRPTLPAHVIGLLPRTTPVSSPQPDGIAEDFVRTLRRN